MTTVRASCSDCGDIDLSVDEVELRMCIETLACDFSFSCPHCGRVTLKPATNTVFARLRAAGARCTEWHLPKEIFETHTGPLIDHRDVLDFTSSLDDDEEFAAALELLNNS